MATSVLRQEHELLGGLIQEEGALLGPVRYADEDVELAAFDVGAALVDLTGMGMWLVSGAPAQAFCEAACAGPRLSVGTCTLGACLLGDGSVASVPLLVRTGASEYLILDASPRMDVLFSWLGFVAHIERDGVRPYDGLAMSDETASLVPLALAGPTAPTVLSDYVPGDVHQRLPLAGEVANLDLDGRITTIVCALDLPQPAYLVLVPPIYARAIWRSLLSFGSVMPVGHAALRTWMARGTAVLSQLPVPDRLTIGEGELRASGMVREGMDFIGARGLAG